MLHYGKSIVLQAEMRSDFDKTQSIAGSFLLFF